MHLVSSIQMVSPVKNWTFLSGFRKVDIQKLDKKVRFLNGIDLYEGVVKTSPNLVLRGL